MTTTVLTDATNEVRVCAKKFINHSDSFVCVCDSTYCDTAPEIPQLNQDQVFVVTTTKANDRFKTKLMVFGDKLKEKNTGMNFVFTAYFAHKELV